MESEIYNESMYYSNSVTLVALWMREFLSYIYITNNFLWDEKDEKVFRMLCFEHSGPLWSSHWNLVSTVAGMRDGGVLKAAESCGGVDAFWELNCELILPLCSASSAQTHLPFFVVSWVEAVRGPHWCHAIKLPASRTKSQYKLFGSPSMRDSAVATENRLRKSNKNNS